VIEYRDAAHTFDNPLAPRPAALSAQIQSARNCRTREVSEGELINDDTKRPSGDPCIAYGAHLGYDPAADVAFKLS
jgi:hypothetical protein